MRKADFLGKKWIVKGFKLIKANRLKFCTVIKNPTDFHPLTEKKIKAFKLRALVCWKKTYCGI